MIGNTTNPCIEINLKTLPIQTSKRQMMRGCHPNYFAIAIGKNTEKSPGELGRFVVTQTLVKDHQLTLM